MDETELVENIIKRVYALRVQYDWTMKELEERCGFSAGYQSRVERRTKGKLRLSMLTVLAYADAFGVDVGWLITGRKPNPGAAPLDLKLVAVPHDKPKGPRPRS